MSPDAVVVARVEVPRTLRNEVAVRCVAVVVASDEVAVAVKFETVVVAKVEVAAEMPPVNIEVLVAFTLMPCENSQRFEARLQRIDFVVDAIRISPPPSAIRSLGAELDAR